jgi:hypothetical protein
MCFRRKMRSRRPQPGDDLADAEGGAAVVADGTRPEIPRVWLLIGEKAGDNAQSRAIADALGWPVESRSIAMREQWRLRKPRVRASLDHI